MPLEQASDTVESSSEGGNDSPTLNARRRTPPVIISKITPEGNNQTTNYTNNTHLNVRNVSEVIYLLQRPSKW